MTLKWLKKLSALLALCLMLGCLSGCDGGESSSGGTAESSETGETGETGESGEGQDEIVKVGYIFKGDCSVESCSTDACVQRVEASKYSNVETYYIDNVNISDFSTAVQKLMEAGCTYIVSANPRFTNVLTDVAGKNMNVNFISFGARIRTVNVYAYTAQMYEASYIAGMAAAFNSETEKIGIVVDPDLVYNIPVINAAALGTQLVYQNAELITALAAKENEIHKAVDALAAKGCDVIISYTESAETVAYCESKGIKVIGNKDYSETADQYDNLLMYFYTDQDSFYLAQFKQMDMDTWEPDEYVGTLANSVINISPAQDCAKKDTQAIVDALIPKVACGDAYIFSGELKNTAGNIALQMGSSLEPAEIYTMDWYVLGVNNELGTFIEPTLDLEINDFEIQS